MAAVVGGVVRTGHDWDVCVHTARFRAPTAAKLRQCLASDPYTSEFLVVGEGWVGVRGKGRPGTRDS